MSDKTADTRTEEQYAADLRAYYRARGIPQTVATLVLYQRQLDKIDPQPVPHAQVASESSSAVKETVVWRCFHCNAVYTDREQARQHFGLPGEIAEPFCTTALGRMITASRQPAGVTDERLDPDMPAAVMRLYMGEMTAEEIRTARAAIRWANTRLLVHAALAAPASGPDQAGGRT